MARKLSDKLVIASLAAFAALIILTACIPEGFSLEAPAMNHSDTSPKMWFNVPKPSGDPIVQYPYAGLGLQQKPRTGPNQSDYLHYTAKLNQTITFTSCAGSESFDAVVYNVRYFPILTQYNRSRGRQDTITATNGSRFAVVFYRTSSTLGTSDLWMTASYANFGMQAGNQMYSNSTWFTIEPVQELSRSNPFGYFRTNNADYGPEYWMWQYYQQPGSNAHDGYIIYEVPENTSLTFRANYAGFGSGAWSL